MMSSDMGPVYRAGDLLGDLEWLVSDDADLKRVGDLFCPETGRTFGEVVEDLRAWFVRECVGFLEVYGREGDLS